MSVRGRYYMPLFEVAALLLNKILNDLTHFYTVVICYMYLVIINGKVSNINTLTNKTINDIGYMDGTQKICITV
jgi:hypothetical protein